MTTGDADRSRVALADGAVAAIRLLRPADGEESPRAASQAVRTRPVLPVLRPRTIHIGQSGGRDVRETGSAHAAVGCFPHGELIGLADYRVLAGPAVAEIFSEIDTEAAARPARLRTKAVCRPERLKAGGRLISPAGRLRRSPSRPRGRL